MRVEGTTHSRVRRGDVDIWVEEFPADGPVCLLVAGAGAISAFWPDAFREELASSGNRMIRFDYRISTVSFMGGC